MCRSTAPEARSSGNRPRRAWRRPRLCVVGDVVELVRGGGGKLSVEMVDGGDMRKPPGLG